MAAYHAFRIEQLQHIGAASIGAGVYARAQPAPAAAYSALGQQAQQQSLVVSRHAKPREGCGYFREGPGRCASQARHTKRSNRGEHVKLTLE